VKLTYLEPSDTSSLFGCKKEEATGEWRKLFSDLRVLSFLLNIIRMFQSRSMSWGHVAGMGWKRKACGVLIGNHVGKLYLKEIA
jgi:hypothetical protein